MDIVTVFGGVELDFRDAVLPGREITLDAIVVFGGLEITVPPEMRVMDTGPRSLVAARSPGQPGVGAGPDAPVLRIKGACVLGGVEVQRKARKDGKGELSRDQRAVASSSR